MVSSLRSHFLTYPTAFPGTQAPRYLKAPRTEQQKLLILHKTPHFSPLCNRALRAELAPEGFSAQHTDTLWTFHKQPECQRGHLRCTASGHPLPQQAL